MSIPFTIPLRFAIRELRAGLHGFAVFLSCLALGVMAIAGVGSVSRSLIEGLDREGRIINGGDVTFSLIGREASQAERSAFEKEGLLSEVATLRAMVRTTGGESALVELKAVDATYPLTGAMRLGSGRDIQQSIEGSKAAAEPILFARFNLQPGAMVTLGTLSLTLIDSIVAEPDRLSGGLGYGPRMILSLDTLRRSGLVQPGALIRWRYRLALKPTLDLKETVNRLNAQFPEAGWEVRTLDDASPQLKRNIDRFVMFLTLVGLTVLVVGGVGIANAVRTFAASKRDTMATLKTLGAPGSTVFTIYLTQTMMLSFVGISIGLGLGAALPFAVQWAAGTALPLPIEPALYPKELGLAFVYGMLTALAFALWPLGRAHDVAVSALFRDLVSPDRRLPRLRYLAAIAVALATLAMVAIGQAPDRYVTLIYIGATACAFFILRLVAAAIMAGARRLSHKSRVPLRLALANVHRPGAPTPSVVLSLGLGLCLLVAIALIDGNITRQLTTSIPERAPSFFFIDVPDADVSRFEAFLRENAGTGDVNRVPMLRGRIISVNGRPSDEIKAKSEVQWVLEGDRGITFATDIPKGSKVAEGAWWPPDYDGAPLVSLEKGIVDGLGLKIGDLISVNVLGRAITAKIAAIRELEWQTLGINFVMVFSPNTFRGAPVTHLATLTFPKGSRQADGAAQNSDVALVKKMADAFPTIAAIRVKDALEAVNRLVEQLAWGIRGVASITLIASILVLAGALAAGQRTRIYDAVILKVLGARRRQLLLALSLEYGILGLATALFGTLTGWLAAWVVVTKVMEMTFVMLPSVAMSAAIGAMVLMIFFGLISTWRVLGQKPAPYLRHL